MTTTAAADEDDPYVRIAKLHSTNIQAAEYGLALINEKNLLETQYKELDDQHESLQLEVKQLKLQLKTVQANKREETLKGETNEETLLTERQTREDYLVNEIARHEHELRTLKYDNDRLQMENEKILVHCQELTEQADELQQLRVKLKHDLKESKVHEQRLIDVNNDLEEDNVALQQQVQKLRENLVDYDGLKHENKQLQENVSSSAPVRIQLSPLVP